VFETRTVEGCLLFAVTFRPEDTNKLAVTLKEKHRLFVSQHWVLRGIFGPNREKATCEWRRLHSEEFYAVYS
jgi:hypothetical protein